MNPTSVFKKTHSSFNFLYLFILLVFIFSCFVFLKDLGRATLDNWDEAWYGEITKQILNTHNFIVLHWNHQAFFEKPPMYMWISSVFATVFGLSEFSIRITSAISAIVLSVLVAFFTYKKWGFLSSFIAFLTLVLNNIFVWRARSGNIDVFATLLIFLSFMLMLSKQKFKYELLGILFACIYLTKSSLVGLPFGFFLLNELIYNRKNINKNIKHYFKFVLIFLLVPSVWLLLGYFQEGREFLINYLFKSDQGVGNFNISNFHLDYLQYAYYSLQRRFFYLFLLGVLFMVAKLKDNTNFLIICFSLFLLIFLSFNKLNNNWYLTPSIPFWSLAIAYAVYIFEKIFKGNKIAISILLLITLYISYKTFTINILPILGSNPTYDQSQSGKKISQVSSAKDTVVRLDHLYPATIYYSNRMVLASPPQADTKAQFLSRMDLVELIKHKKIKWLVGTSQEVDKFISQNADLNLKKIYQNNSEKAVEVI